MTDVAEGLAGLLNKSPQMVRFYGRRMILELVEGRRLTVKEQKRVFNQCGREP